ncbi:hypothetical protein QBC36DRAFT_249534 [Triangularia setosa]|uniref:rRNA adenine N(6)-methyltransferase n=1 Tax=Triangularia setosa TaxID=2587417 RepID=A0AAN6VY07_9PEZI|nr:hypothetical protein QBC36DRAFT_249534 [Podospora setosa]
MLPVRHVAQATILRSLFSRRLINNIAIHHRLVLPSRLHQPLQHRHYARLTKDAATESMPAADKSQDKSHIPGADHRGRFLCPIRDCEWAEKGFSRKTGLARHIKLQHKEQSSTTIEEILTNIKNIPRKSHKPRRPCKNKEPPKSLTRRKMVVDAELQPDRETPAEKDAAPKSAPQTATATVETPSTISILESLLGALGDEEPRKLRARRSRVTVAEAPRAAAHPEEPEPAISGEQPPPIPEKRKAGRPFGSKNKNPIKCTQRQETDAPPQTRRGPKPSKPEPTPGYTADCVNTTYLCDALLDTGIWGVRKGVTRSVKRERQREMKKHADGMRVNIVSDKLCDDVLEYMKPGLLERHKGCDLVDINPGAGLWSRKLNDMLQPRRHILVEEDYGVYEPFLKPLVEREGTKVLETPGVVWKELFSALGEEGVLAEQKVRSYKAHETPERNDTLLVVMNLLTKSKKRLGQSRMGTLTGMVLHQLMNSVRLQGLFQKYGLVRMLIWVDDHEVPGYLPKTVQRRKVGAIQAELSTEWLTQVAGIDRPEDVKLYAYRRDKHIDLESMGATLQRMREGGYKTPEGRETDLMRMYLELENEGNLVAAGEQSPLIQKKYEAGTEAWETLKKEKTKEGTWTQWDQEQLTRNKWLNTQNKKRQDELGDLLVKLDRLTELRVQILKAGEKDKPAVVAKQRFDKLEAELQKAWEGFDHHTRARFLVARDNLRAFKQPAELGPVLMWDRRYIEPLAVKPEEFYPPCEGALLDIQPRAMESTLRAKCPHGSRVYDQLDLIIRYLYLSASAPIGPAVDGLYHGARDGVAEKAKSFHEVALGGSPLKGQLGELDMRALNRTQIVEFIEKWQEWPFKPTFPELVGRLAETDDDPDMDGGGGSNMLGHIAE